MSRVVVVTGGSRGLGLAHAMTFGRAGYSVFIAARRSIDEAVRQLATSDGITASGLAVDLTEGRAAARLRQAALDRSGTSTF